MSGLPESAGRTSSIKAQARDVGLTTDGKQYYSLHFRSLTQHPRYIEILIQPPMLLSQCRKVEWDKGCFTGLDAMSSCVNPASTRYAVYVPYPD